MGFWEKAGRWSNKNLNPFSDDFQHPILGSDGLLNNALDSMDRSKNEFRDVGKWDDYMLPGYGESMNRHNNLLNQLEQQAAGKGPSMADMQMQRGLQSALAQQQALAQSGRGNAAMAARQASINSGNIAQNLAGQGAMARLAEQRGAQSQLSQALQGQLNVQQAQQRGALAYNDARTQRFNSMLGVPTNGERVASAGRDLLGFAF